MYDEADDQDAGEVAANAVAQQADVTSTANNVADADGSAATLPPANATPASFTSLKKAPDIPSLLERKNWLLHHHFIRKEFDSCRALIDEQLRETRDLCEYALFVKGVLMRNEGLISESMEAFQTCTSLNPNNVTYLKQIARSLFHLGHHKAAIETYDEILKLNADDWAKECLKQAITLHRHNESIFLLGKILASEGDLVNAIDVYKRALETSPENPDLLTSLGLLYMKANSFQQAFEALGRALGFDPCHANAIVAAGGMMQKHGDYDVALTKYRVAATAWPDSPQLWNNIAMCFAMKKKYVAAISCLKHANYLSPLDWKILYNLGNVHLGMHQYASAFHFLSAAINLNPKNADLFLTLAIVLTHLEDTRNARLAYEQAAKLDPRDPAIATNYAVFLYKQNDTENALQWLDRTQERLAQYKEQKSNIRIDLEITETAERRRQCLLTSGPAGTQSQNDAQIPFTQALTEDRGNHFAEDATAEADEEIATV